MRIEQRLKDSVARHGAYPAVIAGRARHSYAELDLKSERLAATLESGGVAHGDRVVVFMEDGWEAVVSAFAALKAGAVVVPIDADASPEDVGEALLAERPAALITQSRLAGLVATMLPLMASVRLLVLAGGDRARANDTCLSFEEAIGRVGRIPSLAAAGSDSDTAVVVIGEGPLSHRQLIVDADRVALSGEALTLPPLAQPGGFGRLVAAIDTGSAMTVRARFVREGEADRRMAAMPRRGVPFGGVLPPRRVATAGLEEPTRA